MLNFLDVPELRNSTDPVPKKLESESADRASIEKVSYVDDQEKFMAELKNDKMANDKVRFRIEVITEVAVAYLFPLFS